MFAEIIDYADEDPMANIKMERWSEKPLFGWSGTQYAAVVTKLFSSYCGSHLPKSHYKESNISDINWLIYLSKLTLS